MVGESGSPHALAVGGCHEKAARILNGKKGDKKDDEDEEDDD